MRKTLFSVCLALSIFGCSGDYGDLPPLGNIDESLQPSNSSAQPYISKGNNINNYQTVTIGEQVWMAENLDYNVSGSKCYNNQSSHCTKYGRLYDWAMAMALPSSCNSSTCASLIQEKHRGICPTGWHIPSDTEWSILINYVDGTGGSTGRDSPTAGRYLKATDGWNSSGNGDDSFGFAALPGGGGSPGGNFGYVGDYGYWWSASESGAYGAYYRGMYYSSESAYWGSNYEAYSLFSIRCLQD